MTDKTEASAPAKKYKFQDNWSYNDMRAMYLELLGDYKKLINMYEYCENHNFSLQKENGNLITDLNHALDGHRRCYEAHRKTDGNPEPYTFAELNKKPAIPSGTIANDEVQ